MFSINHIIRINANVSEVFEAISTNTAIAKWFTVTECDRWAIGSKVVWFDDTIMSIIQFEENRCVALHVTEGGGWENTDIRFLLEPDANRTILRFDHSSWRAITDHFRDCSMSWAYFLESLKQFLETGLGTPEELSPSCDTE